jgi:hypothetical protein
MAGKAMENKTPPLRIGVIGGSNCTAKQAEAAHRVGELVAQRGGILVCGGMGGVMEAACRGAAGSGGITVGILPGNSAREGNRYLTVPVITGMGYARNALVVMTSQALIAIGGKYGTLSELAYAAQFGVPVFGLSTWKVRMPVRHVRTPAEAVRLAFEAAKG